MPTKNRRPSKVHPISPPQFIRQHILRMSVKAFGTALHVSGPTVSRYEEAGYIPEAHHDRIIVMAKKAGKRILRDWFQRVPFDDSVPQ